MCIRDSFYVEDGVLYENYTENGKSGVELRFYPSAKTTEEFEIPEGVTALGPNSMQTGRFSSVTFPDSLRSINSYAPVSYTHLDVYKRQVCMTQKKGRSGIRKRK